MQLVVPPILTDDGQTADQIRLAGIAAAGKHGVTEQERAQLQPFSADVVLHLDARAAAAADDLSLTVDYAQVAVLVHDLLAGPSVRLMETLADRIASALLTAPAVLGVDVLIHKPRAPMPTPVSDVAVSVRRLQTARPRVPAEQTEPAATATPAASIESDVVAVAVLPEANAPEIVIPPQVVSADPSEPSTPIAGEPVGVELAAPTTEDEPVQPAESLESVVEAGPVEAAPGIEDEVAEAASAEPGEVAVADALAPESAPTPMEPGALLDQTPDSPVEAVLGLGANQGDAKKTLRAVVGQLSFVPGIQVVDVSPLVRTRPVGGSPGQSDYMNAIVVVQTTLSPRALLAATHDLERAHGRVRTGERGAARPLDIDLITYGDVVDFDPELTIPHSEAGQRAFVLVPWAQIQPDAELPGLGGGSVRALAETAPDREGIRWMALDWLTDPAAQPPTTAAADLPVTPAPQVEDEESEDLPDSSNAGAFATAASEALHRQPPSWDEIIRPGGTG